MLFVFPDDRDSPSGIFILSLIVFGRRFRGERDLQMRPVGVSLAPLLFFPDLLYYEYIEHQESLKNAAVSSLPIKI